MLADLRPPEPGLNALIALKRWEAQQSKADLMRRAVEDREEVREKCSTLRGFIEEAWAVLEPGTKFIPGWHIDAICEHLEAITWGSMEPRLIVNVPPGSMKSLIVSVFWQAWEWGPCGFRHHRFLSTSFELGNVTRDTRKTRDLIMSEWYQEMWPELALKRAGETSFENFHTGTREGVAFTGLTAKRGDRLTIDDPHSLDGAESEKDREKATRRFIEGGQNRLNDQTKSAIVIIMQRLHEADLTGVILEYELGYVHLMIPMEFEPKRRCQTSIWGDPRKRDGELMAPARFPEKALVPLRVSAYAYAGQYQQDPAPRAGGMFLPDMIEVVDAIPHGVIKWVRAWDQAASLEGDWTAGALVGLYRDNRVIIADMKRVRFLPDKRDALIRSTASQDGIDVIVSIAKDPAAAGKSLAITQVRMLSGYTVEATPELGKKEIRADPLSSQVNIGNVMMLRGPWNRALTDEMRLFPKGKHDDQIDAVVRAHNKLVLGAQKAPIAMPIIVSGARASPGS